MIKRKKINFSSIIFLVVIVLLLIPATRTYIQVVLHKGFSYVNQSSIIDRDNRVKIAYEDWYLKSDDEVLLNFKDTKGKVVLVNFWATWCPPCIAEMPSLQNLYNDYKDNVVFLFSTKEDSETVRKFKEKRDFNFQVYRPSRNVPSELKTSSIPRTFIINKKGEIVVDESGAVNWNSETVRKQLDQLLAE